MALLTLLDLLLTRAHRRARWVRLALTFKPVTGAAPPDDGGTGDDDKKTGTGDDDKKTGDDDKKKTGDEDDKTGDGDDDKVKPDDDWQAKARKHERAVKRERKAREEAERKLAERADADKTDHERAVEKAREEAREEARQESQKERRQDRLEVAATRLAAKGFTIGDGDSTQTVKFADPDDALVYIERAITSGDVDEDEVFDGDGKVQQDALRKALGEILESKPHLRATGKDDGKPKGSADARKGDPAQNDLESMTPEDHAKRKYGEK